MKLLITNFLNLLLITSINLAVADESQKKLTLAQSKQNQLLLDSQFPGPFQDTLIQRWVDKSNGNICYLYIPVIAPGETSYQANQTQPAIRVYGKNSIGTISCVSSK